jgi:hypothetical protein
MDPRGGPRGAVSRRTPIHAELNTDPLPSWTKQAGTSGIERALAVTTCGAHVYTVGHTLGGLNGQASSGGHDAFLMKSKASDGSHVWTKQFGSVADDYATAVALNCASGNPVIYVAGHTKGTLPGPSHTGTNQGGFDVFLRKYDADGTLLWSRQRGSSNSRDEHAWSVATNPTTGDIYVAGTTLGNLFGTGSASDAFVMRYKSDGTASSALQQGSVLNKSENGRGIAVDRDGKVYLVGYTSGTFPTQTNVGGNQDIFLAQYTDSLTLNWVRQFGTDSTDFSYGVATSRNASGNIDIFVVGQVLGSLPTGLPIAPGGTATNAEDFDMAIFRFNTAGQMQWATLKGTKGRDFASAIASDGGANVYVVGTTTHDMRNAPTTYVGSQDVVLLKYDVSGVLKNVHQYGSTSTAAPPAEDDNAAGVTADKDNGVYLVGHTSGDINGSTPNQGTDDLVLLRYNDGCSADPALSAECRSALGCGDPHLWTSDRHYYDFQGAGEFILAESTPAAPNPFVVQVRQIAWGSYVAVYGAVAAKFGKVRLGLYAGRSEPLSVNGVPTALGVDDVLALADGSRVLRQTSTRYVFASAQGDKLVVDNYGNHLNLTLVMDPSRAGQVRGLLGNYNGVAQDDFALRDGTVLTPPLSFNQLYKNTPNFANSWRISQAESLFDYGPNESTLTFTNLSFPYSYYSSANLTPTQRQTGEQACRNAGVTDPLVLDGCILDVGTTGNTAFATGASQAQVQQPPAQLAYAGGFEQAEPGPEWSMPFVSMTPLGDRFFLGEFGNETVSLTLNNLPAHATVTVSLDLLILQAWDGQGPFGPNIWGVKVNGGSEVFRATFSNTSSTQSYPGPLTAVNRAGTGAAEFGTLFYPDGDSVYRVNLTFVHSAPSLTLHFFAEGLPGLTNEAWGLDNVEVKVK